MACHGRPGSKYEHPQLRCPQCGSLDKWGHLRKHVPHCVGKCKQCDERGVPRRSTKGCRGVACAICIKDELVCSGRKVVRSGPKARRLEPVHDVRAKCFTPGLLCTCGHARGNANGVMDMGLLVFGVQYGIDASIVENAG